MRPMNGFGERGCGTVTTRMQRTSTTLALVACLIGSGCGPSPAARRDSRITSVTSTPAPRPPAPTAEVVASPVPPPPPGSAPADDGGCVVTSDDGSARVTVAPDGAPAFEIRVIGAMRAQLGGERDGFIAVSAPLAFTRARAAPSR